jgi:exosortase A
MQAGPVVGRGASNLLGTRGLRAFVGVALVTIAVLGIFAPTTWSMVEIWLRSDTFVHGFLVVPAFLYFAWVGRDTIASLPVRPYWPGLFTVAGCCFAWLLAELAGSLASAQFAMIGLVPAALLTVFGLRWLRALAVPCAFLFFAVPFGEVFVPTLIQWTADFTIAALRLSGVPVYREGAHFVIPSGEWSVVDACSGIRYLLASAMSGTLFALIMYRSPARRALFMAAAVLVPIVANWVRAYGTVMLGHLSNNRIAAGVDHLVYGWLFFGFVIFLLFTAGARWREAPGDDEASAEQRPPQRPQVHTDWSSTRAAAAVALLAIVAPLARAALQSPLGGALPAPPSLATAAGWQPADAFSQWRARTHNPTLERIAYFRKNSTTIGVQLVVYRDQVEGAELVNWANQLVDNAAQPGWRITRQDHGYWIDPSGARRPYRAALVHADRWLVVRDWYWLGAASTTSDVRAKVDLALDRLMRNDDTSAWVMVFTAADNDVEGAGASLDTFLVEMGPSLDAALRGLRR